MSGKSSSLQKKVIKLLNEYELGTGKTLASFADLKALNERTKLYIRHLDHPRYLS